MARVLDFSQTGNLTIVFNKAIKLPNIEVRDALNVTNSTALTDEPEIANGDTNTTARRL